MNENGSHSGATGNGRPENPHVTGHEVSLGDGHVPGTAVAVTDRFENPGLPPHVLRHADVDERAAKRAERQVAGLFVLSIVGTIGFLVAYFTVPMNHMVFVPFFGNLDLLHTLFGIFLGLSLLGIGLGAVHWAKTLMPDEEVVEHRHPTVSSEEDRRGVLDTLHRGMEQSQLGRRKLIRTAGGISLGIFALPLLVQVVGGLGKMGDAERELRNTFWRKGLRLMTDPENRPIKAADVTLGSVYHVLPEGIHDKPKQKPAPGQTFEHDENLGVLERKAKAAVLLMRLDPAKFVSAKARDWGFQGIVAYSKICTHAGCPVGLYEQQTHHLLCPCHQSTFDVTNDCEVVFGPAKRPLPQLKITVDKEGYLVADQGFMEPVGPSFWTRAR
ncbi:menaquinol-cytochrome c reductase iron-sulfur subunit precursor [Austwickia chelonae]|uniref:Cytochrome bc1 complex Rieske iron-sulfur subunit n=1 Tax=Austwickia chelonae NBRC 105200 TaxID=1184607 RepID=K6V5Y9_9MICO|nr:Rieske 2Fe-2S domain-containing protein [Austwickia chelonae]GAB77638.1 menaquinol-cytochrome c reductase iron-sulfur subunit [Austwickia chelonae NBRC 105200]SEW14676.1 menaquinol-cytochrome c reductase iron-sulfur subunit precursor [Austwickia chelonae]